MSENQKNKRLKKYSREHPDNLPNRRLTARSLEILDIVNRYKFIPTSLIVRLVEGNRRITARHLQNLYHQGFVNRFAFPTSFHPTEFNYFLDNAKGLDLLKENGAAEYGLDYKQAANNRGKGYDEIILNRKLTEKQGKLMHLSHELMISRFQFMLEAASRKTNGMVKLLGFYRGTDLWNAVEVNKTGIDDKGFLYEKEETERLPHRPDAFFALHFPESAEKTHYYFYEADRKTMNTTRMIRKYRAHFHYIVKQRLPSKHYGIGRIKAVLTETIDARWAENLRRAASHPLVSGAKPSPLFWFTSSEFFEEKVVIKGKEQPLYLDTPEVVFQRIWATPQQTSEINLEELLSLIP